MKDKILEAVLLFIIAVLVLNTFKGWFVPTKNDIIAREVKAPKTDTILIESEPLVIAGDTIFVTKYEPNKGQLLENNITNNYKTYVLDTLSPALKIANNKIDELQRINATLQGKVKATEKILNSAKVQEVYYKDKYFEAITRTDTLGNSDMEYKYNATLDVVTENKRRFLRKDIQTVHITSPDKNFRVNGVEHFKKETFVKPRNFGIGLQVGYHYVPSLNQAHPTVGVGISYNLIKL